MEYRSSNRVLAILTLAGLVGSGATTTVLLARLPASPPIAPALRGDAGSDCQVGRGLIRVARTDFPSVHLGGTESVVSPVESAEGAASSDSILDMAVQAANAAQLRAPRRTASLPRRSPSAAPTAGAPARGVQTQETDETGRRNSRTDARRAAGAAPETGDVTPSPRVGKRPTLDLARRTRTVPEAANLKRSGGPRKSQSDKDDVEQYLFDKPAEPGPVVNPGMGRKRFELELDENLSGSRRPGQTVPQTVAPRGDRHRTVLPDDETRAPRSRAPNQERSSLSPSAKAESPRPVAGQTPVIAAAPGLPEAGPTATSEVPAQERSRIQGQVETALSNVATPEPGGKVSVKVGEMMAGPVNGRRVVACESVQIGLENVKIQGVPVKSGRLELGVVALDAQRLTQHQYEVVGRPVAVPHLVLDHQVVESLVRRLNVKSPQVSYHGQSIEVAGRISKFLFQVPFRMRGHLELTADSNVAFRVESLGIKGSPATADQVREVQSKLEHLVPMQATLASLKVEGVTLRGGSLSIERDGQTVYKALLEPAAVAE